MSRELLLLGLVRRQHMHAYQLNDFLEKRLGFLADLKKPTTYAILERLRQDGHLVVTAEREGNRPERRVYETTPQGDAYFYQLLRENLAAASAPRSEDAIGLYFLDALPAAEVQTLLRERLAIIEDQLSQFRPKLESHRETLAHAVLDHYVAHLEADRAWLDAWLQRWEGTPGLVREQQGADQGARERLHQPEG